MSASPKTPFAPAAGLVKIARPSARAVEKFARNVVTSVNIAGCARIAPNMTIAKDVMTAIAPPTI